MSMRVGVEIGVPGVIIVAVGGAASDGLPALAATAIPRLPRTFLTGRAVHKIGDELEDRIRGRGNTIRDALIEDRSIVD